MFRLASSTVRGVVLCVVWDVLVSWSEFIFFRWTAFGRVDVWFNILNHRGASLRGYYANSTTTKNLSNKNNKTKRTNKNKTRNKKIHSNNKVQRYLWLLFIWVWGGLGFFFWILVFLLLSMVVAVVLSVSLFFFRFASILII